MKIQDIGPMESSKIDLNEARITRIMGLTNALVLLGESDPDSSFGCAVREIGLAILEEGEGYLDDLPIVNLLDGETSYCPCTRKFDCKQRNGNLEPVGSQ